MVKAGAGEKALVLNHRLADRSSPGSVGSPTKCGRCVSKPANASMLVVCVTASSMPDCSVSTPVRSRLPCAPFGAFSGCFVRAHLRLLHSRSLCSRAICLTGSHPGEDVG